MPMKPRKTNLVVKFTDNEESRQLIEDKLNMAGVSAPQRRWPSFEDEQGPGVLVPTKEALVHVVRAVLQKETTEGRALEESWDLGFQIGEKCKVDLVFGETECSYKFGESTFESVSGHAGAAVDLLHEIDRSLKQYSFMLHKIVRGAGREYENLINRLKNTFKDPTVLLFSEGPSNNDEDDKLRIVVAFYFGLVYGKLEALLVATGLKDEGGAWGSTQQPLEFRIGWMDYMDKFLHDVHSKMWELSIANVAPHRMHSVFSFIGMCCTSKSLHFGSLALLEDIVGFWTGSSLLMLATALMPGINPTEGAKLVNYPYWFVNLSTSDGVHVQSSKWIEGEEKIQNLSSSGGTDEFSPGQFEDPPQRKLKIFLCPNYVDENAKVVHSMMCEGDIVYIAPVMGALVNLHNKTVGCSCGRTSGGCDGTAERKLNCPGGLPIYSGLFKLGNRDYHGISGNREEMPEEVGVMMARFDIPWRFAAACIYHDTNFVIAESCLSCAKGGKSGSKVG